MGARKEVSSSPRQRGRSLNELRGLYDIQSEQDLIRGGATYDDLVKERGKKSLGNSVLRTAEKLQSKIFGKRVLEFASPPQILTADVVQKAEEHKLRLLAVPIVPFKNPGEMAATLIDDQPSALKDMYGDYLRAAVNGAAPINMTGHYVFIDESGPKTALSTLLGIEDLDTVDSRTLTQALRTKGKDALHALGFESGAHIGVITLEEAKLSKAVGEPVYGITSTANHTPSGETTGLFALTEEGLFVLSRDAVAASPLRPRLVVRLTEPNTNPYYLKPPYDKTGPAVTNEDSTEVAQLEADSSSVGNPLVRRRARQRLGELASTSKKT